MNWLRYALIAGIFLVSYMLFLEWNKFQEAEIASRQVAEETLSSYSLPTPPSDLPTELTDNSSTLPNPPAANNDLPMIAAERPETPVVTPKTDTGQFIAVKTDTFDILIDTRGGDIVKLSLPQHLAKLKETGSSFELMNQTNSKTYVAQSGLLGPNGTDKSSLDRPNYRTQQTNFVMSESDDSLFVDLFLDQGEVKITKRFTFKRGSYLINIDYLVDNQSNALWRAVPYGQIRRSDFKVASEVGFGMQPFLGAAITTREKNYAKYKFSKFEDEEIKVEKVGGWVAMVQHYFISAWIPDQESTNHYKLRKQKNQDLYILEYAGAWHSVEPGEQGKVQSAFYAGPKYIKELEKISPYLDLTIDYSWLWFIAKPLFLGLDYIHGLVHNWGLAIILLTLCIKIIFYYPSAMSYRSMAKMRKLQPMMTELKERFGDDRQKMSAELMKIYRKEKVNPLGGCLPILLQMPVFIALYWVLMESVELRHAPFIFWINDLSVKDPFFILPLIMGATMFIQQKLNPTPPDPMQAKIMQMMPIFFTVLFLMFPAGLVLYWVVNNTLSIVQQYLITRQIEKAG